MKEHLDAKLVQTPWLERAREQSRRRAAQVEDLGSTPPMDWSAVDQPIRGPGPRLAGWLRFSWVAALVLLMTAGGATGTWAYVEHLKHQVAKETKAKAAAAKLRERVRRIKRRKPVTRAVEPVQKLEAEQISADEEAPTVVPTPRRKLARKAKARAKAAPVDKAAPPAEPNGEIIFNDPSMPGGGHVIIVTPPFRMEPLFDVKRYRQKGPGGMSW